MKQEPSPSKQKPPASNMKVFGLFLGLGFTIVIPMLLGVWLGSIADGLLHWGYILLLLGLLLGLIFGVYGVYRLLIRARVL
jgi:F0F1-type ATP synthase assembly protein I